jgi:hypothetical protein
VRSFQGLEPLTRPVQTIKFATSERRILMDVRTYFEGAKGLGVLATADDQGHVDVAVYAIPHIMDASTIAFIMPDRLTHHNLQSNAHAAYLFKEDGPRYKGVRLFLKKLREEQDTELLHSLRRKKYAAEKGEEETSRYLVFFTVEKTLPLIGAGEKA